MRKFIIMFFLTMFTLFPIFAVIKYVEIRVEEESRLNSEEKKVDSKQLLSSNTGSDISQNYELYSENTYQYAYSMLNNDEKKIYREIYCSLIEFKKEVVVSTCIVERLDKAFQCVMLDHPELFYIDGYTYTKYSENKQIKKLIFSGNYTYDVREVATLSNKFKSVVSDIINNCPSNSTDYEKVKYVYETIINSTEYNTYSKDNQNIVSVFIYHSSVCQGYAKAMQYLLNTMND